MDESNFDILQFFEYEHLPKGLQEVSRQFYTLAHWLQENTPQNDQKRAGLLKLLEAKDCAVRSRIYKPLRTPEFTVTTAPIET